MKIKALLRHCTSLVECSPIYFFEVCSHSISCQGSNAGFFYKPHIKNIFKKSNHTIITISNRNKISHIFDMEKLIDLDACVISALKFFSEKHVPKLDISSFKKPLIVGSGNAEVTGKILCEHQDHVFADESTYKQVAQDIPGIDGALLISASGGKHSPKIAKFLKSKDIPVILLTCNPNSLAGPFADKVFISPKKTEPYTYNTSTYLGMILEHTRENPKKILDFIQEKINPLIPKNFPDYNSFFIIVPGKFNAARELFLTKFDELFGSIITCRCFTPEQSKHAKTVVPSEKEMFLSFGYDNKLFGYEKNRINFPLPDSAKSGAIMAIIYYVIGNIQKQNHPYFKENIVKYTEEASKQFGQRISPVVD